MKYKYLTSQWITIWISILILFFGTGIVYKSCNKNSNEDSNSSQNSNNDIVSVVDKNVTKAVQISAGDYKDVVYNSRKIRIKVVEIKKEKFDDNSLDEKYGAIIDFDTGGGLVYGGIYTKYVFVNKFLMPEKWSSQEEPYSVYYFHTEGYFSFFRAFVENINHNTQEVTINLFFH